MTITRRDIATTQRNNPTENETDLWNEIRGLQTGARWTRKKWRHDVLVDFYCASLRLCILCPSKKRDAVDAEILRKFGFSVLTIGLSDEFGHSGARRVELTRWVNSTLWQLTHDEVMEMSEVDRFYLDSADSLHVDLKEKETPEIRGKLFQLLRHHAAGARLFIHSPKMEEDVDHEN